MSDGRGVLGTVAVLSVAGLALVVGGVGVLAVIAEYADTWTWFFRLERAASMAVPVVVVLLVVGVVSALGLVFTADSGGSGPDR